MKILLSLFILFLFASCSSSSSSSTTSGQSKNFDVTYNAKSALMQYELKIEVNRKNLKLNYKNVIKGITGNYTYDIKNTEADTIYMFLKSNNMNSVKTPPPEKILDVPTQTIKVRYDGKSNTIDFGTVADPPGELTNLRDMLFELASRYNRNWKRDLDL